MSGVRVGEGRGGVCVCVEGVGGWGLVYPLVGIFSYKLLLSYWR